LMVGMHYEIESRRFKNSPEERVIYGWEEPPQQSSVFDAHYPFSPEEEVAPFS
jgi:hypothetical protein